MFRALIKNQFPKKKLFLTNKNNACIKETNMWQDIFSYDFGIFQDNCFEDQFNVCIVPSASQTTIQKICNDKTCMKNLFDLGNTYIFRKDEFMTHLETISLKTRHKINALYRVLAMMILADQCTKLQFLINKYKHNDKTFSAYINAFRKSTIGEQTLYELENWHDNISSMYKDSFDETIFSLDTLTSLENVMTIIVHGVYSITSDIMMIFNSCGNFFGSAYAVYKPLNQHCMIGIRSSVIRMISCHRQKRISCLHNQIGKILYASRCKLAKLDGFDRVSILNPIGGMLKLTNHPELKTMFKGLVPFDETLINEFLDNVDTIMVPPFRRILNHENMLNVLSTYNQTKKHKHENQAKDKRSSKKKKYIHQ